MIGWIIAVAALLVLCLLSLIRLGGRAYYGADGFEAYVLIGPAKVKLFPADPDRKRPAKEKKVKKARQEGPEKETTTDDDKPGTIGRALKLLPDVAAAAGGLKRRIRIDNLILAVTWGAEDAASAAIGYGKANALLGMIWPLLDNNFKVKKCDWQIDVDYQRTSPQFTADAAITITVGQLITFAVYYGIKLLKNWHRSGKRSIRQQEAVL